MRLVNDNGDAISCLQLEQKKIAALSNERLRILKMLARQPMYAAEIAREMNMEEQALYYHLKLLQKAGLVKFMDYEERRGGIAKRFAARAEGIAIVLKNEGWQHFVYGASKKTLPKLFAPFIEQGAFHGRFIVGSPDPHGRYRARASEFSILELAMLLGNYATFSFPLYSLDTQIKEEDKKQNIIIAGGPKVNMLAAEINAVLPISFDKATFEIYSRISRRRYSGNIGAIELLPNPFSTKKKILLVGGLNHHGTRAAILAIIKKMKQLEEGSNAPRGMFARVVEGYDEDGDGTIDSVEILE